MTATMTQEALDPRKSGLGDFLGLQRFKAMRTKRPPTVKSSYTIDGSSSTLNWEDLTREIIRFVSEYDDAKVEYSQDEQAWVVYAPTMD